MNILVYSQNCKKNWLPNLRWLKKIQSSHNWWYNAFGHQACNEWKHFIVNCVVTEFFSYHMFLDLGYPIDGGLIFTIDLAIKCGMPGNKM